MEGFARILHRMNFRLFAVQGVTGTWDVNNGIVAVYLNDNEVWLARVTSIDMIEMKRLFRDFGIRQGAAVPNCDDGGVFLAHMGEA